MKLFKKQAFTLVELIVVITILAILGTIAFINLQGYSTSARDGKRLSDINNIFKKISIERTKGVNPSSFLLNGLDIKSGLTIGGIIPTEAKQGTVNFQEVKEDNNNFKDPIGNDYVYSYGIGGSGTGAYKFVQLATINEENNQAVIVGDYYKLLPTDSESIIFSDSSDTNSALVVNKESVLPYNIGLVTSNPPPVVCNYQQADIDELNIAGGNGDFDVYDSSWNNLIFPLTLEQWCDDVSILEWYGGSTILPEIFTLNLLKGLYLGDNSLTALPTDIGNLTSLQSLYLYNNLLTTLPAEIGNLTSLEYLDLGYNLITTLPIDIWDLINLENLSFYNNSLTTLSTDIGNLINLQVLDLGYNSPITLPTDIWSLTNLQELGLYGIGLTELPTNIGNLINLQYLYLHDNSLTTLPAEIGDLTNLEYLYLHNNAAALGDLSYSFNIFTPNRSQLNIPTAGQTMTIGGNGTNIVISVTP